MNNMLGAARIFWVVAVICSIFSVIYFFMGLNIYDMTIVGLVFLVLSYLAEILEEVKNET